MATKPGTLSHAKGFVINKLYEQRRFGGSQLPVAFLSQGYPPKWRHFIGEGIEELRSEGIVRIQIKRTRPGSGEHAAPAKYAPARPRSLLNAYRQSASPPT